MKCDLALTLPDRLWYTKVYMCFCLCVCVLDEGRVAQELFEYGSIPARQVSHHSHQHHKKHFTIWCFQSTSRDNISNWQQNCLDAISVCTIQAEAEGAACFLFLHLCPCKCVSLRMWPCLLTVLFLFVFFLFFGGGWGAGAPPLSHYDAPKAKWSECHRMQTSSQTMMFTVMHTLVGVWHWA